MSEPHKERARIEELEALCAAVYQIIGSHFFEEWREDPRWLPVMDLLALAGNGQPLGCDPMEKLLPPVPAQ